jgi:hypothetical protein
MHGLALRIATGERQPLPANTAKQFLRQAAVSRLAVRDFLRASREAVHAQLPTCFC